MRNTPGKHLVLVIALAGLGPGLASSLSAQETPVEDRIFIVDGSGSISFDNFAYELDLVQEILCGPGAPNYRANPLGIAIIQFGSQPELLVGYTVIASSLDAAAVCAALDMVLPVRGNSNLAPALFDAKEILEVDGQAASRSMLVMTDANIDDEISTIALAASLRQMTPPTRICAAHISDQCDLGAAVLQEIANDPRSAEFTPLEPDGVASCTRLLALGDLVCLDCTCGTDCNANGALDAVDIIDGTSLDLNGDGVSDECADCNNNGIFDIDEILEFPALDCNVNALLDACEIIDGSESDCDGDGVLDSCELAGASADCNGNTIPDECEVAAGTDFDCNGNGVLDSCDLLGGGADCNGNGIPDECEFAVGIDFDCNGNGVLDSCDLAGGGSTDCDGNLVPDDCEDCNANGLGDNCEATSTYLDESPTLPMVGPVVLAAYTIVAPPLAESDVTVTVDASGPLAGIDQFLLLALNGVSIGTVFNSGGALCTRVTESVVISAATFNTLVAGGNASFNVFGANIQPSLCPSPFIEIDTSYQTGDGVDINGNGVPDDCDRATGDSNLDGMVGIVDFLAVLATWGPCVDPATCFTDFDRDGIVGIDDFLNVLAHWGPV